MVEFNRLRFLTIKNVSKIYASVAVNLLMTFFFKFVPLDYSVPVEVPVKNCKPDKLPLFKRQYENAIFIGKFLV